MLVYLNDAYGYPKQVDNGKTRIEPISKIEQDDTEDDDAETFVPANVSGNIVLHILCFNSSRYQVYNNLVYGHKQ